MTKRHRAIVEASRPSGLTDLSESATRDISAALNGLLADVFAFYLTAVPTLSTGSAITI